MEWHTPGLLNSLRDTWEPAVRRELGYRLRILTNTATLPLGSVGELGHSPLVLNSDCACRIHVAWSCRSSFGPATITFSAVEL
jgi:hypothetical protein